MPAAIAAARMGAKVLIVERNGYLGGNATMGLPWLGHLDRNGRQVIGGIAQEFNDKIKAEGQALGHSRCGLHNSVSICHPDWFKIIAFEYCRNENIDVLLHLESMETNVENGVLQTVTFYGKGNKVTVGATVFVDATGDGDVAYLSGCRYEKGHHNDGKLQPPSMLMSLIGVDEERLLDYLEAHPEQIAFNGSETACEEVMKAFREIGYQQDFTFEVQGFVRPYPQELQQPLIDFTSALGHWMLEEL